MDPWERSGWGTGSVAGEGFVEVEEQVGDERIGGEFGGIETGGDRRLAEGDGLGSFPGGGAIAVEMPGEGLGDDGEFVWGGLTGEDGAPGEADPVGGCWAAFGEHALGEIAGGLEVLDVVHQLEGLQRGVAAFAAGAGAFAIGGIEGGHEGGRRGALEEDVEAAAVEGWAGVLLVVAGIGTDEADGFPDVGGLIGFDALAAHREIGEAGDEQGVVAELFGIEPEAWAAGEQTVVGIAGEEIGGDAGRLSIGGGGDEETDEGLGVPAGVAVVECEPVEEIGMTGHFALGTEILGGADEAFAEELLPETIGGDAGGEWVVRAEEPAGEVEAGGGALGLERREDSWDTAGDLVAGFVIGAADHDEAVAGFLQVLPDEGGGDHGLALAALLSRLLEFCGQGREGLAGTGMETGEVLFAKSGDLIRGPVGGGDFLEDLAERSGQIGDIATLLLLKPGGEGLGWVLGGIEGADHAGGIPGDRAAELGEGDALDLVTGLEPDLVGIEFEPGPDTGFGQGPAVGALGGSLGAPVDGIDVAPGHAMFPVIGTELDHQGAGRIGGIEEDMDEEARGSGDVEGSTAFEDILGESGVGALEGAISLLDRGGLGAVDPAAGLAGAGGDLPAGGDIVIDPGDGEGFGFWEGQVVGRIGVGSGLGLGNDAGFDVVQAGIEEGEGGFVFGRGEFLDGGSEEDIAVHGGIGGAVEEGVEGIEFAVGDGIELVVMADGATGGQAHPGLDGGGSPFDGVAEDELGIDGTAFAGGDVAAIEPGGDPLIEGWVGEEIAGELFDGELVVGQVAIEGGDDPVAVGPHLAFVIEMKAVGIGVTGDIEPMPGHAFTEAW